MTLRGFSTHFTEPLTAVERVLVPAVWLGISPVCTDRPLGSVSSELALSCANTVDFLRSFLCIGVPTSLIVAGYYVTSGLTI